MRPAREGRENKKGGLDLPHNTRASMRPAREGRENAMKGVRRWRKLGASMRPAREGRENPVTRRKEGMMPKRFNEARP